MDFNEALDALKAGKKVKVANWVGDVFVWILRGHAVDQDGLPFAVDFIDTQSEWELYDSTVQPKWIKFSEQQPKFLPFWFYADGNVSIKMCHDDDYLTYVEDKESAAWMMLDYPLPPKDEKQYSKWQR
jgi:hypothetical protein